MPDGAETARSMSGHVHNGTDTDVAGGIAFDQWEVSVLWLIATSLTLGGLAVVRLMVSRRWPSARQSDLGWMSQRWLAEHRASGR